MYPSARPSARTASDFAHLSHRIAKLGLLDRRPVYYGARLCAVTLLFTAAWVAFAELGDSWWQLAVAAFLAVMFGQIALVSHDLAHRQVFRTRKPSEVAGRLAGNLAIGMSYGWWMDKHTRHHANPNHAELDPDVDPDILVWSKEQARASRGLPRFIGKWQAFLFFPLLTLEGWNLHYSGVRAVLQPRMKHRLLEAGLLVAHFAWYFGAVFTVLPLVKALVFIAVHQGLWGIYLGSISAPNHKGMPMFSGAQRPDFLRRQVLTSRNVRGGRFVDNALGGLNYQIEHHLFPSMPSPNLRHRWFGSTALKSVSRTTKPVCWIPTGRPCGTSTTPVPHCARPIEKTGDDYEHSPSSWRRGTPGEQRPVQLRALSTTSDRSRAWVRAACFPDTAVADTG